MGEDSAISIATMLQAGKSRDKIPVEARYSAPVQTSPGVANPVYYTTGTGSVSQRGRGMALTTHLHLAQRLQSRTITLTPSLGLYGLLQD